MKFAVPFDPILPLFEPPWMLSICFPVPLCILQIQKRPNSDWHHSTQHPKAPQRPCFGNRCLVVETTVAGLVLAIQSRNGGDVMISVYLLLDDVLAFFD